MDYQVDGKMSFQRATGEDLTHKYMYIIEKDTESSEDCKMGNAADTERWRYLQVFITSSDSIWYVCEEMSAALPRACVCNGNIYGVSN